jgi:rubrerythrin
MNKYLKQTSLFALVAFSQPHIKADWNSWQRDPADKDTLNKAQRLAEQQIEKDMQPHNQNSDIKDAILNWKTPQSELIKQYLAFRYLSKSQACTEAENMAKDCTKDKSYELLLHKAAQEITKAETANEIIISDQGKEIIIKKVRDEVVSALRSLYNTPSSVLKQFTQGDYYSTTPKMERLVNQEVAKLPKAYITSKFTQKYFSENDITEVYPKGKIDAMRRKIDQGKVARDPACSICLEEFSKLGKRVNLDCGEWAHGHMCMGCAIKNIHLENDTQCPVCRHSFYKSDFPIEYFKENMNKYDFDILRHLDPELVRKIAVLFNKVQ